MVLCCCTFLQIGVSYIFTVQGLFWESKSKTWIPTTLFFIFVTKSGNYISKHSKQAGIQKWIPKKWEKWVWGFHPLKINTTNADNFVQLTYVSLQASFTGFTQKQRSEWLFSSRYSPIVLFYSLYHTKQ